MTSVDRGTGSVLRDASGSAVIAGAIAVLVAFSGPLVLIVQAAHAAHLSEARLSSWIWAISVGSGVVGIILSLRHRAPIVAAWSTPGAALLISQLGHYRYAEAVGAYLVAAALTVAAGLLGRLDALIRRIPAPVVSAVLAGLLLRFGLDAFGALEDSPAVAAVMLAGFVVLRRTAPRYAVLAALLLGVAVAAVTEGISLAGTDVALAVPEFTAPQWSADALTGLALPLFVVTMASQNAPGMAVLRASGYTVEGRPLLCGTGIGSAVFAPFGAHALNLAAITAAICAGPEAHPDPRRRYVAGLSCGALYIVVGLFGATVAGLFAALPPALVATTAGIALMGTLSENLSTAFTAEPSHRDAALVAFLATASGITLLGLGPAFWGLVFGVVTRIVAVKAFSVRS